jgi:hypothetical protein
MAPRRAERQGIPALEARPWDTLLDRVLTAIDPSDV